MSTAGTALTFSIGAILGAGWVNAFSKATKESETFAGKAVKTFGNAKRATQSAEKELRDFQKLIGDKTPTETQESVLEKLNKELAKTKSRLEQATTSVSAWMSVSAATGKFKLQEYANATTESFSKLKSQILSVSGFLSKLFFDSIANSARALDEIGRAAENLGISSQSLQRFQFAAARAGITSEKLADYLTEMNKRISEAAAGSGEAAIVLQELGLSAQALNGKNAAEKFELIAKAMEKVKNSADQARYADKLFGGEAVKTVPALVRRGWGQIVADMDAAGAHIVKNEKATEISRAYIAAVERISVTFNTLKQETALSLMPALEKAMDVISSLASKCGRLAPAIAFVTSAFVGFKLATVAVTGVVATANAVMTAYTAIANLCRSATLKNTVAFIAQKSVLLASAAATGAVAAAMGIWKGATLAMTAAQWALNAAMAANPVGLVIVGIAALAAALAAAAYAVYSNWEPISEFFSELCGKIGAGFSAAWAGIRDGFAAALNFVRSGVDWLWNKIAPLLDALKKLKAWWSGEEAPAAQPAATAPAAAAAAVPALSGADLESMSRAAISNSNNVRTDARTFNTNANFTIVQQPGEDAEALARRVSERLAESYSGALAAAL